MKRAKCLSVCLEDQKAVFQEFKHLFVNVKKLPSSESNVFKDLSKKLSYRMSPKALYLSAKRHFVDFFCDENVKDNDDTSCAESINVEDDVSSSSDNHNSRINVESFEVDCDLWQKVKPTLVTGQRNDINKPGVLHKRRKRMPKHKWTNIFCEWIWIYTKNRCTWMFKNSSVSDDYHMKCTGTCKECNSKINITTTGNCDSVTITCSFENVDRSMIHRSKNKLSSHKTKELALQMKNQYPIVLRNKMINNSMQDDETSEPPFIPNLKSLQNIRNRYDGAKRFHKIVVFALWIMPFKEPWANVIRTVSLQPFFIHYWTELQLKYYYKNVCSKKMYTVVSIDATGSIFKKISPPNSTNDYESKHLFLYVVMLKIKDMSSVPLSQMISALQTMDNIFQWLKKWIGEMKTPNEVICDDSAAIIGAVVNAFTRFTTTREYLSHCFNVLNQRERCQITCLLRLDTSHFLKSLYRLQCFKFVDIRVKSFYIRCLLRLKNCTNFETAKIIIQNLIIVALQKYDRYLNDGSKSKSDRARDILKSLGVSSEESVDIEHYDKDVSDTHETDESYNNSFTIWFDAIVDAETVHSDLNEKTDYENIYYLPNFVGCFRKLVLRLPLWSNVMFSYMSKVSQSTDVATSSNVESYFKNIKTLLLHSRSGLMRVDDFIMKHTEYLTGELRAASCANFQENLCSLDDNIDNLTSSINHEDINYNKDFRKESVFKCNPKLEENWRNKTENQKTPRLAEKVKPRTRKNEIEILPNGNICASGIENVVVKNTCAFDAILNALLVICTDYVNIFTFIISLNSAFSELVSALVHKDIAVNCIINRTEILKKNYQSTLKGNIEFIDCACNVTFVLEKILIDDIFSATLSKVCSDCKMSITKKVSIIPLNILILSDKGVASLNESATSMLASEVSDCKNSNCNGKVCTEYLISDYLIFFELDLSVRLCDIPNELLLSDKIFELAAVVEFISNSSGGVGHYKTHCQRRNSVWECYDDMARKAVLVKSEILVDSHLLIYKRWRT